MQLSQAWSFRATIRDTVSQVRAWLLTWIRNLGQYEMTTISYQQHLNYPTMLTADVEKIAELASAADGL